MTPHDTISNTRARTPTKKKIMLQTKPKKARTPLAIPRATTKGRRNNQVSSVLRHHACPILASNLDHTLAPPPMLTHLSTLASVARTSPISHPKAPSPTMLVLMALAILEKGTMLVNTILLIIGKKLCLANVKASTRVVIRMI